MSSRRRSDPEHLVKPWKPSLRERLMDVVARLHRPPPICPTCGTRERWMKVGDDFWAWQCPHWTRQDHWTEVEDSATPESDHA